MQLIREEAKMLFLELFLIREINLGKSILIIIQCKQLFIQIKKMVNID